MRSHCVSTPIVHFHPPPTQVLTHYPRKMNELSYSLSDGDDEAADKKSGDEDEEDDDEEGTCHVNRY